METPKTAPTSSAGQDSLRKETSAGFKDSVELVENKFGGTGSDDISKNDITGTFGDGLDHEHEPPVRPLAIV